MRLAEALLRVPDAETAIALTADQLGRADFDADAADGPHRMLASLSASAIALSKRFLPEGERPARLAAAARCEDGRRRHRARLATAGPPVRARAHDRRSDERGGRASASRCRTCASATTCWARALAPRPTRSATSRPTAKRSRRSRPAARPPSPHSADGISMKLSALFSRYEDAQRERVFAELLPRVWQPDRAGRARQHQPDHRRRRVRPARALARRDGRAGRAHRAAVYPQWRGFGLAVQAYQTRALAVVDEVARIARRARPALHGAPGQGRLLGWRGQARAGAGPARLPGVHAQAPHRHLVPGLRAGVDRTRTK